MTMTPAGTAGRRTRVIGLGNPILGDDGVGWRVVEAMRGRLDDEAVDVLCLSVGGVSLMEQLVGCDRALLVDAGVEVDPRCLHEFNEELSPEVTAAVPEAVRRVEAWLADGR
jgi:Ni,Fe-hydrogenase maturation factor